MIPNKTPIDRNAVIAFFTKAGITNTSSAQQIANTMFKFLNQKTGTTISYDSNDREDILNILGITDEELKREVDYIFSTMGTHIYGGSPSPKPASKNGEPFFKKSSFTEVKVLNPTNNPGNFYNQPEYGFYLVQCERKDKTCKILEGFEYKQDAIDRGKEIMDEFDNKTLKFKVLTRKGLLKYSLSVYKNSDWANPEDNISEATPQGTIEVDDESKAKDLSKKGFNVSLAKKGTTKAMGLKPKTSTMFEEETPIDRNNMQIFETLYRWIELFGGDSLLSRKHIQNGTWLKKALESGDITCEEIDAETEESAAGLKFSELPLYKKVAIDVNEHHQQFGGVEPYNAIDIAAQYTDEDLEQVAGQIVKNPEDLYNLIIQYIPDNYKLQYKKEFAQAYKLNPEMLSEDKKIVTTKGNNKESKTVKKADHHVTKINKLKGGKGDKLTAEDVNPYEYLKGLKIEREHTEDEDEASEIVLDHLSEDPMYYTNLVAMEKMTKKKSRIDLPKDIPAKKKLNTAPASMVDKKNGMETIKKDSGKKNASDSMNKKEAAKGKPKGVKEMPVKPKKAKGIKDVFKMPGKETKKKIDEGLDIGATKLNSQYIDTHQFLTILRAVNKKKMPALMKTLVDVATETVMADGRIPFDPIKKALKIFNFTVGGLIPDLNEKDEVINKESSSEELWEQFKSSILKP